jgi:Secretion system C-terminal sorting domain
LSVVNSSTCLSTSATTSVVVSPRPPAPTISGGSNTLCSGSTFTLTGTAAPNLSLQWVRSPGTINNLGTGLTQIVDKSGAYRPRATDQLGCSSFSSSSRVVIADHVFSGSITSTDSKQVGRLSRSTATNCASTLNCTVFSGAGTSNFGYDTYTVTNPRNTAVCATIGLVAACNNLFGVAYLGSFNPNNLCQNYIGDVGLSPFNNAYEFTDVTIPANGTLVFVVHEISSAGCGSYNVIVDMPRETPAITVSPSPVPCGSQATLTASTANTYLWNIGGAITKTITPTITPTNTNYGVTVGYGNNGCTATATTSVACGTVLPVEILNFSGYTEGSSNRLVWETANEINNKGFQVERASPQPQQGALTTWDVLGFVNTKGKAATYDFTDKAPPLGAGGAYYRLRQMDNDGKETLSKIISLSNTAKSFLKVYPNPATDVLTVEFTKGVGTADKVTTFEIINLLGQIILRGPLNQSVDVSSLPNGTYIVRLSQLPLSSDGGGLEQVKFVKQ